MNLRWPQIKKQVNAVSWDLNSTNAWDASTTCSINPFSLNTTNFNKLLILKKRIICSLCLLDCGLGLIKTFWSWILQLTTPASRKPQTSTVNLVYQRSSLVVCFNYCKLKFRGKTTDKLERSTALFWKWTKIKEKYTRLREDQGALPTTGESMAANSLNIDNFSNLTHLPTQ